MEPWKPPSRSMPRSCQQCPFNICAQATAEGMKVKIRLKRISLCSWAQSAVGGKWSSGQFPQPSSLPQTKAIHNPARKFHETAKCSGMGWARVRQGSEGGREGGRPSPCTTFSTSPFSQSLFKSLLVNRQAPALAFCRLSP